LPGAAGHDDDRRAVAGAFPQRPPDFPAGFFIERNDARVRFATDDEDQQSALDEWRTRRAQLGFRIVPGKVSRPDHRTAVGIETMEMSVPTQRVEPAAVDHRRGVGTCLLTRSERPFRWCYRVSVRPEGSARGDIEAMDALAAGGSVELEVEHEDSVPDHHRTRKAKADRRLPPNPQRSGFHNSPRNESGAEVVPVGTAPLRPVGCHGRNARRHVAQDDQHQPEPDPPKPVTRAGPSERGGGNRGHGAT
jgi:hypothetical protein